LNMSGEPLFPEQLLETKFACLSITSKSGWRKALTVLLQDLSVRFHLIFEISRNSALRVRSHVRTTSLGSSLHKMAPRRNTASNGRGWLQNGARMSHTLLIF
jgi:hypothetical protein